MHQKLLSLVQWYLNYNVLWRPLRCFRLPGWLTDKLMLSGSWDGDTFHSMSLLPVSRTVGPLAGCIDVHCCGNSTGNFCNFCTQTARQRDMEDRATSKSSEESSTETFCRLGRTDSSPDSLSGISHKMEHFSVSVRYANFMLVLFFQLSIQLFKHHDLAPLTIVWLWKMDRWIVGFMSPTDKYR